MPSSSRRSSRSRARRGRASGTTGCRPVVGLVVAALLVVGCGDGGGASGERLTLAYQPGLSYAQLLIMKEQRTLEQALPDVQVSWRELSSGASIRDGIISGDIQVGAGGISPFLLGVDAGVPWKLLSGLNIADLWVMVPGDSGVQSIDDFEPGDKIAVPAPDSFPAIVLRKAAQEQLGNAKALDSNIVALAHPDALQALLSDQIAGHATTPPFQYIETDNGARKVLGSTDVFGETTSVGVFAQEDYMNQNPDIRDAVYRGIQEATELIDENPAEAARVLSRASGGKESARELEDFLTRPGTLYTTAPRGYISVATFMKEMGTIKEVPASWKDLVFENLESSNGS